MNNERFLKLSPFASIVVSSLIVVLVMVLVGCPVPQEDVIWSANLEHNSSMIEDRSYEIEDNSYEVVVPPHMIKTRIQDNSGLGRYFWTVVVVVKYETEEGDLLVTIATRDRGCGVAQTLIED